jgi:predicted dithiol-disulfide oxidoreductase (DUF899 family)
MVGLKISLQIKRQITAFNKKNKKKMSTEENGYPEELSKIDKEIETLRKRRIAINSKLAEKEVQDYTFKTREGGEIKLSEMFGDKKFLYIIHNMGKECSYCSMWADGFNSIFPHIEKKGAFVLISPNHPKVQKEFAEERGWKFNMYSDQNGPFTKDMGYVKEYNGKEGYWPGVSVFEKSEDGKMKRVSKDEFGPGDFYCNIWHFFDLLPSENITMES